MDGFSPPVRAWFAERFGSPTAVQEQGWRRIADGSHSLLVAPTGSGKTLAAFLWGIDRLSRLPPQAAAGVRLVYVSPLKALVYDIERNLRAPLEGLREQARRQGRTVRIPRVDVRTGDTPARARRQQAREPAEILVTTPESLYLILGSAARSTLRTTAVVIVDEIHAMAATKRGAHLAISLERLAHLAALDPQRIGLSATAQPTALVARYLGGDRDVVVVDVTERPLLDLEIVVPVKDMRRVRPSESRGAEALSGDRAGIWPAIYPRLLELISAHHSTLLFVSSRGLCERLCRRLNELDGQEIARAHHGSISHEQRAEIEAQLGRGELKAIVATSSLELGIDMGAVDLVVMVGSPGSVAHGLQRVGRAGHRVGEVSRGRIVPRHPGDLLESAVVAHRMSHGAIEPLRLPRSPLDVLAQQIVAMCAVEPWSVDALAKLLRRTASFAELGREEASLRPRIGWDRHRDLVRGRRGAKTVAALGGGIIADRGRNAWLISTQRPVWSYVTRVLPLQDVFCEHFDLGPQSVEELRSTLLLRHAMSGYRLHFERPPGHLGWWLRELITRKSAEEELIERDFFDQLHRSSGGILSDALRLWLAAVAGVGTSTDTITIGALPEPPLEPMRRLPLDVLLTLRQVARQARITPEDHASQFRREIAWSSAYLVRLEHWGLLGHVDDCCYHLAPELAGAIHQVLRDRGLVG